MMKHTNNPIYNFSGAVQNYSITNELALGSTREGFSKLVLPIQTASFVIIITVPNPEDECRVILHGIRSGFELPKPAGST